MKRIFTMCITLCTILSGFAQTDTTAKQTPDTIKIGNMVIIREPGTRYDSTRKKDKIYHISNRRGDKPANLSTNWWIFDIGFSNYVDNTDYAAAISSGFIAPGVGEDQLKARAGKSRNVNIWILMQRLNLIKHIVNLKYGLGIELNNYHFEDKTIEFSKNPTYIDTTFPDGLSKNKLAADYITVPMMINFNFTPDKRQNFGISVGVSAGYLYSARQKIKLEGDVDKTKGDFDLQKWKLSYIGEISLGPVKLYGSYAFQSMFEKGLDLTPYTVGLRFSNW